MGSALPNIGSQGPHSLLEIQLGLVSSPLQKAHCIQLAKDSLDDFKAGLRMELKRNITILFNLLELVTFQLGLPHFHSDSLVTGKNLSQCVKQGISEAKHFNCVDFV